MRSNKKVNNVEIKDDTEALIYIPDISGFTEFINEMEIRDSKKLIPELLELMIDDNQLNMHVYEVQGDAVLFYRLGESPPLREIAAQTKRIFLDFHSKLRKKEQIFGKYNSNWLNLSGHLTLKVIVHYGRITVTKVKEQTKLMGTDVILAHKLLKNDVPTDEYLLLSDGYLKTQKEALNEQVGWSELNKMESDYEHVGKVNYSYVSLTPLRKYFIHDVSPAILEDKTIIEQTKIKISAPLKFLQSIILDLDLRPQWLEGVRKIKYEKQREVEPGISYIYYAAEKKVEGELVYKKTDSAEIILIEKLYDPQLNEEAFLKFIIKEKSDLLCELYLSFHNSPWHPSSGFSKKRKRIKRFIQHSLKNIHNYCQVTFMTDF